VILQSISNQPRFTGLPWTKQVNRFFFQSTSKINTTSNIDIARTSIRVKVSVKIETKADIYIAYYHDNCHLYRQFIAIKAGIVGNKWFFPTLFS